MTSLIHQITDLEKKKERKRNVREIPGSCQRVEINFKVTVISIIVEAFVITHKKLEKRMGYLQIWEELKQTGPQNYWDRRENLQDPR